ncbi:hypothetical protein AZE42_11831, partial [Rhizopogon vesiculosus]
MVYDPVVLTISAVYLLRYNVVSSRLGRLIRVLIYDGIAYFIVLTGKHPRAPFDQNVPPASKIFNIITRSISKL